MKTKRTSTSRKFRKAIIAIADFIIAFAIMLGFAILLIASDMAEHPEMSGYEPGTSAVEVAADIVKDIASA